MVNIIPAEFCYASINNKGYFQGIYAPSRSQILYLFQFAGEMSNSHMYKFPQNNLYSYNIIAHSLRKIHISGNREKKTVQRLIYIRCRLYKAIHGVAKIGSTLVSYLYILLKCYIICTARQGFLFCNKVIVYQGVN